MDTVPYGSSLLIKKALEGHVAIVCLLFCRPPAGRDVLFSDPMIYSNLEVVPWFVLGISAMISIFSLYIYFFNI